MMQARRYYVILVCPFCGFEIMGPLDEINVNGAKIYRSPDGNQLANLASSQLCPFCHAAMEKTQTLLGMIDITEAYQETEEIEVLG